MSEMTLNISNCITVGVRVIYKLAGAAVSALFTWILVDKYIPDGVNIAVDTDGVAVEFKTEF